MNRFLALCAFFLSPLASVAEKPNIIVILADDLGWKDVGYHGGEVRTPNIDSLAKGGTRLEQFYVQPTCTPTRAALMTGRYPVHLGMHRLVLRPWHKGGIPHEEQLLPNALQSAGYWTAIAGKWHLGMSERADTPIKRGFDLQYGHLGGAIDYYKHEYYKGLDWSLNLNSRKEEGYSTDLITDQCVRVIENHSADKPFFFYLAYNAPHAPLQAPEETIASYAKQFDDPKRRTYAAMVTRMDQGIGRVLAALEKKKLRKKTLIFFCSDNGGSHAITADNGHLRGEKGKLYEGGVRVPALANWPGTIPAGKTIEEPLHIVDLYPTLVGLASGRIPDGKKLDGLDAWKTISKGAASPHEDILINVKKTKGPYLKGAIRKGRWKLVVNGPKEADPNEAFLELFDLVADPSEKKNLAQSKSGIAKDLHERLKRYREGEVRNPAYISEPDGWKGKADWTPVK